MGMALKEDAISSHTYRRMFSKDLKKCQSILMKCVVLACCKSE